MEKEKIIEKVKDAARGVSEDHGNIIAVYLYGSFVEGNEDERSDIDIAILFDDYKLQELLEVGRKIQERAGVSREVDVRALNSSDSQFAFRVVKDAVLLYEKDREKRADMEQSMERKYHDMKPYVREYRDEMKRRVKNG